MTAVLDPGQVETTGQTRCARFPTSSTSIVTAFFSWRESPGGVTTTAWLKSKGRGWAGIRMARNRQRVPKAIRRKKLIMGGGEIWW